MDIAPNVKKPGHQSHPFGSQDFILLGRGKTMFTPSPDEEKTMRQLYNIRGNLSYK